MELQAFLVLCGVGVAGIAVLLLMGLFSTSGTSYEEAIAQQRKATTELLALAENKNKTKKSSKKTNKKLAKKEKSKENSAAMGSEQESEAPAESGLEDDTVPAPTPVAKGHVEFSPPVVVDVPRDTPPNVKIRKRGKDPKVKPILVNKEDPSCVNDPNTYPQPTNVVNHFEELHPKDDFELLHSTLAAEKTPEKVEEVVEKKESKPAKPAKGKPAPKAAAPVEVKEEVVRERHNSGDAAKDPKKVKKVEKKTVEEVIEPPQTEVVPPLNAPQPSELTTEKLLKQALSAAPAQPTPSPPGGKGKKKKPEPNVLSLMAGDGGGVNVGELVRVVRDAALSRTEIQILTDALLNKHHDPLPQHSEWTEGPNDPMQKLKKQLADKEKALADEIEASQALHAKLKELRANLNSERTRAAAAARASEQTGAAARAEVHTLQVRLQRLLDENHTLTNEKLHLQSKLSAEAEGQAQRAQMEMHIQRLSEAESSLVSQLNALQAELSGAAVELGKARLDAGVAREALGIAQQHANELAQQLQDGNRAYADLEQHAQQELRQAQERLVAMTELQNEVQRLASRAQAAEANAEKIQEEANNKIQQLSSEVASLGERLAAREAELAEIKQLKAVPAQNGLTMSAENEQQKAAELAKVESVVEALRDELASAQKSSREQREQLTRLQEQLQQHQDKNNELRTKNWKVMEALQSAEKALQTKATSALPAQDSLREAIAKSQEAQYNEIANVLRAVCPSAAPESVVGREWLHTFAENLKSKMHELATKETVKVVQVTNTTAPPPADDRVEELTAQNEQLQGLVDKYKTIIDDTEGVLSRLQQNVTTEEERWAQQLADKQRELDELRQRTVLQMQCKIDALQAELQQAKSSGHNHSFGDAERLAEERLMSGLSDKHVDTCNGPLQVGLDEK
ncbi:hypothetical protein K1T71_010759 [Dendrolimus kikuchii]|uniref:Uncharacterized protein n=1 Tax=Dendrolimus kikuchii TaxID=765133 RepID=A0ACC1CPU7_9NEOP|nr:hypothetical protein K1T71_010759 [Dendrolimus kikuchii]